MSTEWLPASERNGEKLLGFCQSWDSDFTILGQMYCGNLDNDGAYVCTTVCKQNCLGALL